MLRALCKPSAAEPSIVRGWRSRAARSAGWPLLAIAGALALSGCATVPPPSSSHLALLDLMRVNVQGGPVEVHAGETPSLMITTRAEEHKAMAAMMFPAATGWEGVVRNGHAFRRGAALERQGDIADPSPEIARRAMAVLEHEMGVVEGPSIFRLVVLTQARGIGSKGFYQQTRVDLVDSRTDTPVAWALCRYQTPQGRLPADLEAMLDDPVFAKQEQDTAIAECVDYFALKAIP